MYKKQANDILTSVELCAGAGGQVFGLEKSGFTHTALIEIDKHCCNSLRHNRPDWNVPEEDIRVFKERAADDKGMDLLAGGLPARVPAHDPRKYDRTHIRGQIGRSAQGIALDWSPET